MFHEFGCQVSRFRVRDIGNHASGSRISSRGLRITIPTVDSISMRVRDGVLDIVGNCYRSVTSNAHFNHDLFKTFSGSFATVEPILEVLIKSFEFAPSVEHVPVHQTHSAKVI